MKSLSIFLFLFVFVTCHTSNHDLPKIISDEVKLLKQTKKISHTLTKAVNDIGKIKDAKFQNDIFCQTCNLVIDQIIEYRAVGNSKESLKGFFQKLCRAFTDWGAEACNGYIDIELDTVLFIMDNKKDLTSSRVCGIYFQSKGCSDPDAKKWDIPVPPVNRSHHNPSHYFVEATPLKILHLTDFHFDPLYQAGSNAKCDLPLCCQKQNGPAPKPSQAAGFWGDYHVCDVPWYSVTNFTSYLTKLEEKYDYVYYTGDIISHRSWATDKDANTKAVQDIFKLFKDTFDKVPVYAVLGNHEPHPTDFYSPDGVTPAISTQWMFDLMATEWSRWLPSDTKTTIRAGGYYTVLVKPNFRIVALNSNVCFISNLWLLYEDEDPYNQLKWLVKVLTEAEKHGEFVHILSHIPPGEVLCAQQWSNQFHKIVQRFAPIIVAQFNGHTHLDELRLFRDVNDTNKIVNVAYNAGSFTTFVGFNPNYRTYDIDPNKFSVLDYDHFYYNLSQANLTPKKSPEWKKLYSFKDAYGLKDTTYGSLGDLITRMHKNKTLVQQYWRFQGRNSTPFVASGCNDLCEQKLVCFITAVEASDGFHCQGLKSKKRHHKQ